MAERLLQKHGEDLNAFGGLDPTAVEAAARAHDLGHPPFGHVAEDVLMQCCDEHGIDGYEGNAQSFRIVSKLARRSAASPGLNLTRRTLRAVLKYPWLRASADLSQDHPDRKRGDYDAHKKWGAYVTEVADFEFAMEHGRAAQASLEAQIMDFADDITYAVHDLEDFYRAGLTPVARLQQDEVERRAFNTYAAAALAKYGRFDPGEASEALDDLMTRLLAIPRPYSGTDRDRSQLHGTSSVLITRFIEAMSVDASGQLFAPSEVWHEVNLLKRLTWHYVINSPSLATIQEGQKLVIRSLFTSLLEWVENEENRERFPTRLRELTRDRDPESVGAYDGAGANARAVADYVSGLTEAQTFELHGRLHGTQRSSVLHGWVRSH